MDENPLSAAQRNNIAKAVALLTAMNADPSDVTFFARTAASYVVQSSVAEENLERAIDLISGLSIVATALLADVEDSTGVSPADRLQELARRVV